MGVVAMNAMPRYLLYLSRKCLTAIIVSSLFPLLLSGYSLVDPEQTFLQYYLLYLYYGFLIIVSYGVLVSCAADLIYRLLHPVHAGIAIVCQLALYVIGGMPASWMGVVPALLFLAIDESAKRWIGKHPALFILPGVFLPIISAAIGFVLMISRIHTS
ncbi:hypothetical protein LOK74_16145 [Brevibacillus humidisoli]|uniref:hypothetical protein n=1 Tax=Brevibacillus humidisoli TaxID=2895522 RepID=UPI001E3882E1|nr:hypothetical protein [Brevibacillus humidisoli]UFJ39577.1 hypothetical protein LOK74_16145 [Brevibacillus humidisoli]